MSSAGNTRGLIEARSDARRQILHLGCLPRGIPAASLKQNTGVLNFGTFLASSAGNTRGLIEARPADRRKTIKSTSSAGNTRGLIEARMTFAGSSSGGAGLPRGIPAASLKLRVQLQSGNGRGMSSAGNTRGLIEASKSSGRAVRCGGVFRGEYPRPH